MSSGVIVTTWSWPSSIASRVNSMNAATSEPRKFSPSPRPTTSGELRRAPTTTSGWAASQITSVNAPSSCRHTARTASGRSSVCSSSSCSRCATVSVSVSEISSWPVASSLARRAAKFSMMPLWTTAMRPVWSRCGCALRSLGAPCVAQRVWPMPVWATGSGLASSSASRLTSLPAFLADTIVPSWTSATPPESYPRYSRRLRPPMTTSSAERCPTYPTIPHMASRVPALRAAAAVA